MKKTLAQVVGLTAIAVVLAFPLGIAGWLLVTQPPKLLEGWASRSWTKTTATVTHAAAVKRYAAARSFRQGGNATHVVELRYVFDVDGQGFIGTRRSLDAEGTVQGAEAAQREAARYPLGRQLDVWYDRADPNRSLLEPGVPVGNLLGLGFALVLLAIAAIPLALWWQRRRKLQRWRNYR